MIRINYVKDYSIANDFLYATAYVYFVFYALSSS